MTRRRIYDSPLFWLIVDYIQGREKGISEIEPWVCARTQDPITSRRLSYYHQYYRGLPVCQEPNWGVTSRPGESSHIISSRNSSNPSGLCALQVLYARNLVRKNTTTRRSMLFFEKYASVHVVNILLKQKSSSTQTLVSVLNVPF